jgi:peptidoglycan/LPS O-acetylase OafA/YrhL
MFSLQLAMVGWMFLLFYTPILLFCFSGKIALSLPSQRLLEAAGNMTYSSYLLHFPIQILIALGFSIVRHPIPFYDDLFFASFVVATLLASYLTYRYFEAPAQTLIRSYLLSNQGRPLGQLQSRL